MRPPSRLVLLQLSDRVVPEERLFGVRERHVPNRVRQSERGDDQRYRARRKPRRVHGQAERPPDRRVGRRLGRGQLRDEVRGAVRRVQLPGPDAAAQRHHVAVRRPARLRVRQHGRVDEIVHRQFGRVDPEPTGPPKARRRSCDVVRRRSGVRVEVNATRR